MLHSLLASRCPSELTKKLLVFALFFTSLSAFAQQEQLVLWKVSGKGLKQSSYLFGTVHTTPFALLEKFPLQPYLAQAQFGVFEVIGRPIAPARPPKASAPARPQPPLDSLFSQKDYALVDSFFAASPLGSIKAHNTDASLQTMMYAAQRLIQNPVTELISLDEGLAQEMKRLKKPLFSLDPADDPDRKAQETDYTFWANGIVFLIRENNKKSHGTSPPTEAAYVAHLSESLQLNQEAPALLRKLTVRRNLVWIPELEQKMQEGACFVAVGLAHLKYKDGLIKLLRQRGYKLKQIALPKNP